MRGSSEDATAALLRDMPRGEGALADQLRRASDSVLLNLAEGAARIAPRDKARFYAIALGSGAESAAALDLCAIRRLADAAAIDRARGLLDEVQHLLAALERGARRRAPG